MKKFMTAVFFLSLAGLGLDASCLDNNQMPSTGDYIAFMVIGIVLIVLAIVSSYGAGIMYDKQTKTSPKGRKDN